MIDKKVIDGHVIPGHVIFTAPAHLEHAYSTEAFEDNLKVTATFFTQNDGKQTKSESTVNGLFILMTNVISPPRSVRQVEHSRWRFQAHDRRCAGRDRDGKYSREKWSRSLDSSSPHGGWYDSRQVPRGM